jgi:hypothetical protein
MDGRDYVVRDNPDERPYELLRDGELVDETLPAEKGVTFSPVQTTEACHLQVSFLAQAPTWLFRFVSMDVARGRAATRVPQMCPECVRAFSKQTTTKYRFAGTLRKPSDGLEPSTPPYHGSSEEVPAYMRGRSRTRLACKSTVRNVSVVPACARMCDGGQRRGG